jgi:hypothetical protein
MNWAAGVIDKTMKADRPVPTVSATAAFAAGLAGRYQARPVTASRVELALAYDAPAQLNTFQHSSQVSIGANVTVEQAFTCVQREIAAALPGAEFGAAQAENLFERLFSRRMRTPSFAAAREPETKREPSLASTLRTITANERVTVERVFPRSHIAAAPTPEVAARPPAQSREWPSSPSTSMPPKPVTLAPLEIKRVAEQVIREIDHRIIAHRERMGGR